MITTSKDLLFITLAFCILWLTIFFSIMLYYLIVIIKRGKETVDFFKEKMEKTVEVIDGFKKKIGTSMTILVTLSEGIKQALEIVKKMKEKKEKKNK